MLALPNTIIPILAMFRPMFTKPTFESAKLLLIGAILAPGKRTVTAVLRILGFADEPQFQKYHRVLNRARWSSRQAAGLLLQVLVETFGELTLVFGLDETIERRRGAKIAAKGIYRDAVRASHSHFTKASGLRWISLMLLSEISWAGRVWALPFFTVLAPSERYHTERGLPHRTLAEWACLMISQVRRWLPHRAIVLVADSSYAVLAFLHHCTTLREPVTVVTRLRLDAQLYAPAPPRQPGTNGRPRRKGERLPTLKSLAAAPTTRWHRLVVPRWYGHHERIIEIVTGTALWYSKALAVPIRWVLIRDPEGRFETQALLCTDLTATPLQIISWFLRRWQMETTFQAVRTHLGVETQRQWNEQAIARTTPALLALFSLVTLLAHPQYSCETHPLRHSSWYVKEHPTFADAIACVRRQFWRSQSFVMSLFPSDHTQPDAKLSLHLIEALCYAA